MLLCLLGLRTTCSTQQVSWVDGEVTHCRGGAGYVAAVRGFDRLCMQRHAMPCMQGCTVAGGVVRACGWRQGVCDVIIAAQGLWYNMHV